MLLYHLFFMLFFYMKFNKKNNVGLFDFLES